MQYLRPDKAERGGHSALPVVKRDEQEFAKILFVEGDGGQHRRMRGSFATYSQEPRQGPRSTRHWLKRLTWRS